ncbi:hypothetical protein [Duncaniella dubosii]|nr:hypothetical protein [Duncaniella dubosii]MCX4284858.1 hypothetical protein [Duncaniella dubosii]
MVELLAVVAVAEESVGMAVRRPEAHAQTGSKQPVVSGRHGGGVARAVFG